MEAIKSWCIKNSSGEESSFFGGDDEESQVPLYSKSLDCFLSCFALRTIDGNVEPIFFVRRLPKEIKDNHLLASCLAIQALRDLGIKSYRAWITTGEAHLPVAPEEENFEILTRFSTSLSEGGYQVKTGRKCLFCPARSECDVYKDIDTIVSLCSGKPAWFTF